MRAVNRLNFLSLLRVFEERWLFPSDAFFDIAPQGS
jgi:hypothetical protein